MNDASQSRRFAIRTELPPEDTEEAERYLSTIRLGNVTPDQFSRLFPAGCLQDAMCHEGTDAEGRSHVYFAAEVLEAELPPAAKGRMPTGPSHQVLFALALLRLEQAEEPDIADLRSRAAAKRLEEIPPIALQYLLTTADGGWAPRPTSARTRPTWPSKTASAPAISWPQRTSRRNRPAAGPKTASS